ncbi:Cyclomaltodextrin glucanotransferase precursor [Planctomycetes bacterium CA13]|uniref:Cyclomaltodextrin glucanotransferase n=1 Tax=Novipirellula herctigrandis TaxID=2527986 RepID=A0A5C5Z6T5_9BACT|nr:Cyclomaltodextrin glucanotransferase precursor [Planctomycetes bacterium CA13]
MLVLNRLPSLLLLGIVLLGVANGNGEDVTIDRSWNEDIIYFALTDRFCDGDPSNNTPRQSDPQLYDASQNDINRYHGGDFRGLEIALRSGYFNKLGVTTLWLTPPIRNAWHSPHDLGGPKTGYHGYWAQDFLDIDPHLTSTVSIDGKSYSDDRDGRMMHYKDLVTLAHEHGIKVIQDAVCNHIGPLFYYDENGNQQLDMSSENEWIAPYSNHPYTNTRWVDLPQWNLVPPNPDDEELILGHRVKTTGLLREFRIYGRHGFNSNSLGKSDGEEVKCDFFSLRDMATHPDSEHFDALVNEFVEIYYFYIHVVGIDGMRLDTVKHVHHEFWSEFTHRLRDKLGEEAEKLLITGEVYDGNPFVLGRYTFSLNPETGERDSKPCLDSLLNFQFCFNLRDYLRKPGDSFGHPWGLQNTTNSLNRQGEKAFYNSQVGVDGLAPRQKMVNFFENHDGLNRFLVPEVDEVKHRLALAILMTTEGIPCIYYGAEASLRDSKGRLKQDGETGRMTYCEDGDASRLELATKTASFELINRLSELRAQQEALHAGAMSTLWVDSDSTSSDDGLYVFARYVGTDDGIDTAKTVIVAINANPKQSAIAEHVSLVVGPDGEQALARSGDRFHQVRPFESDDEIQITVTEMMGASSASIRVEVPPSSAVIYIR